MTPADELEPRKTPQPAASNGDAASDGQQKKMQNNNRSRRPRRGRPKMPRETAAPSPKTENAPPQPAAPPPQNPPAKASQNQSGKPRQQRGKNRGGRPQTAQSASPQHGASPRQERTPRPGGSPRPGGNPVNADQPTRPQFTPADGQTLRSRAPRRPETRQPAASNRPPQRPQNDRARSPFRRDNRAPNNRLDANNLHVPSIPRRVRGGIKARSEDGEFGKNWWAKRWLLAMERLMDGARLQRGRKYARMGQVLSMNEANGGMLARVQGSRPAPYKVTIRVAPLSDEQWEKVYDVLADQAIFAAQLLAGEMPPNIEEAFSAAGVSLFPARGGDLMTECSCPDWVNPCKHIAATHYILGDRFDEDPFLLLRMRGRTQEEILQALRQRRTGVVEAPRVFEPLAPEEEMTDLEADFEHFWEIGAELDNFEVNVQPPSIPLPILKRLGDPDFASKYRFEELLGPAYEAISQTALFLAFNDMPREDRENGDA